MTKRTVMVAFAVALAVLLVGAVPTQKASASGHIHCVRYGETLYGIAARYGTSAYAIAHHNGMYNPNFVRAGTCLQIPHGRYGVGYGRGAGYGVGYGTGYGTGYGYGAGYGKGTGYGYGYGRGVGYGTGYGRGKPGGGRGAYCVRHGDTLSGIAWRYGVSPWSIARYNGLYNPNYIYAGQCLRIPSY